MGEFEAVRRAIDYIEEHLDDSLPVAEVAEASFYSAPHLSWMFKDVTGMSVGEYIRKRRLSEAAISILRGADILDAALSYGFSSQQVFTRCFGSYFGLPPAAFRRHRRGMGRLVPSITLPIHGGNMKLIPDYNWKNGDKVDDLMERVLTEQAIEAFTQAVEHRIDPAGIDEVIKRNLLYVGALRLEGDSLTVNVPVIRREDSSRMFLAGEAFGVSLADIICESVDPKSLDAHPRVRNADHRRWMSHFLTGTVTLGWQGHGMLTRLGRIPSRAEYTDDRGRWYLLRFFEPNEDEYAEKKTGGGGTWVGKRWALSTIAATRDQNILGHFAGLLHAIGEDEYDVRLRMSQILVDGLGDYADHGRPSDSDYGELSERIGLNGRPDAPTIVLRADEFAVPQRFMNAIYGAMVEWWNTHESAVDEVLDEMTPKRHGIAHRRLYHWAWCTIVGCARELLRDRGFLVDLMDLPNGAINTFWEPSLDLQGDCMRQ